jgi:hypothetical protein
MDLARSVAQFPSNSIEVILGEPGHVSAFGQVLPQESIGVFVAAALPGAVRVGEENRDTGHFRQALMLTHLLALVIGQGFAHRFRYAVEHACEAFKGRQGRRILDPHQHDQATGPLHQGADCRTIEGPLDQVAFPMSQNETIIHLGRAHVQGGHVLDLTPSILTASPGPPHPSSLAQTAQQFRTQFAFGHHVERGVDRLVRHPLLRLLRIKTFHRAGHLFGRPALPQEVLNDAKQNRLLFQLGRHAALKASGPGPVSRLGGIVSMPIQSLSVDLATDRTR